MDVLADFLEVAGAVAGIGDRLSVDRSWSHRGSASSSGNGATSKFLMYAVECGQLQLIHAATEFLLEQGDVFFVQEGTEFLLSALSEDTCLLTGHIEFTSGTLGLSTLSVAPIFTVRPSDDSMPAELVKRLGRETKEKRGGWMTVSLGTVNALFIAALRASGACSKSKDVSSGWMRGMADAEIGAALSLMHQRPEHRWTVAELASELSVSRSAFAARFKSITGRPPLEYLTWWRLQRAAAKLRSGGVTLSEVARLSGYQSEAAFGKAFRREFSVSPGHVRRQSLVKSHTPSQLQLEIKKRDPFAVPEQEIGLNLLKTSEIFKEPFAALMNENGLMGPDYNILRILRGRGVPIAQEEILDHMVLPLKDIQSYLDRLISLELIHAAAETGLFSITEAGKQLLARLDVPIVTLHRRQLAHFSNAELEEFNRLLVKARNPVS